MSYFLNKANQGHAITKTKKYDEGKRTTWARMVLYWVLPLNISD